MYARKKNDFLKLCAFKLREAKEPVSYDYQYNRKAVRKF